MDVFLPWRSLFFPLDLYLSWISNNSKKCWDQEGSLSLLNADTSKKAGRNPQKLDKAYINSFPTSII